MRLGDIPQITMTELSERYEALFFDAYGVLVHHDGCLPGALQLIARLNDQAKPYWILSNDASRLTTTTARRYRAMGLAIDEHRILNSGLLIAEYFRRYDLSGARCVVWGPTESEQLVRQAGGVLTPVSDAGDFDVLLICDEASELAVIESLDQLITALARKVRDHEAMHLVLPNPDLIYLRGPATYGVTAGSIALLIEAALERIAGSDASPRFDRLGKPHAPLFELALQRCATRNVVMIGDQLQTDIAGACRLGLDSAFVQTGVSALALDTELAEGLAPTYRLSGLVS